MRLLREVLAWTIVRLSGALCLGRVRPRGLAQTIPPDRVVLELLEDQLVDEPLIEALAKLRIGGYQVALDDSTLTPDIEPLLPKVDIVKLDLRALGADGLTSLARDLSRHRLTLVAEKLEGPADFEVALAAGCHLLQGYFFCRPEVIEGTLVAPNKLAPRKLAADVQDPSVDLAALSDDAGNRQRSQLDDDVILAQIGGKPRELFVTALVRARFCQLTGQDEDGQGSELFALGLFSVVDALTDRPMDNVVGSLPFPPAMRDALINRTGSGRLLDCVAAMEEGEFRRARQLVPSASEHYLEALTWTNETARHLLDGEPSPPAS